MYNLSTYAFFKVSQNKILHHLFYFVTDIYVRRRQHCDGHIVIENVHIGLPTQAGLRENFHKNKVNMCFELALDLKFHRNIAWISQIFYEISNILVVFKHLN